MLRAKKETKKRVNEKLKRIQFCKDSNPVGGAAADAPAPADRAG